MTHKPLKEEQKIITAIEKLPFAAEDRTAWIETIQKFGLNEVLVKEIMGKIATLPRGEDELNVARSGAELNRLIQSWRLSTNLGGGKHKHT